MPNELKMAIVQAIRQLLTARWALRRIARQLGIDRGTLSRYARSLQAEPKPAIPPTGSDDPNAAIPPGPPVLGREASDRNEDADGGVASKPAIPPAGSRPPPIVARRPPPTGRPSLCDVYREPIAAKFAAGLSAQRIWQDLTAEHGFTAGYDSVKRFVRRLAAPAMLPFRRLECAAGEEAQVDFGTGAPLVGSDGKRRRTHVFRVVLSHSRKGYAEATCTQTTEDFLRALENAVAHFGGVPER